MALPFYFTTCEMLSEDLGERSNLHIKSVIRIVVDKEWRQRDQLGSFYKNYDMQ